jgi:hypothetical protein
MRKHRDGERATNQSKAGKLRWQDHAESAEKVKASWEVKGAKSATIDLNETF